MEKIFKYNDVARLFSKIKGFYLTYSNTKINPVVEKWNVSILKIDQMARHKDTLLVDQFWKKVNDFLLSGQ